METGEKVSKIVRYGSYIYILFGIAIEFLGNYSIYSAYSLGRATGATMPMIIGAFVVLYCANKNVDWASKMNKNVNIAWLAGILLGLFGLLLYWVFYKVKTPKVEEVDSGVVA